MQKLIVFISPILATIFVTAAPVEGYWSSVCFPFGRHALQVDLRFTHHQYNAIGKLYERPGSDIHTVRVEMKGDYTTSGNYFDHTPKTLIATLKTVDVVQHYNRHKLCGYDDWQLNEPRNIMGRKNCVGVAPSKPGARLFDIFSIKENDSLVFSAFPLSNEIDDTENRPLEIKSSSIKYERAK